MAFSETTASALDSALDSVYSSEALSSYVKHAQYCHPNRLVKLA